MTRPANQDGAGGAAYWLVRQDAGPLSPDEQSRFSAWLDADPEHGAQLDAMRQTLEDPALTAAMARFAPAAPARGLRPGPSRRAILTGGLAASVALALGLPHLMGGSGVETVTPLSLPPGGGRQFDLADGSHIQVNGGTDLSVALDAPTRRLQLARGEAFIDIAASGTPFQIDCAALRIAANVGALNLDVSTGLTEISVYEGEAVVTAPGRDGRPLRLRRGDRASLEGGNLSGPVPFDPLAGDFRTGWLVTKGLSLVQLVERLNRTATLPIRVTDQVLATRRVAGRFRINDPNRLLASLGKLHGFNVQHTPDALVLHTTT